jgi:serine/threonine protein kinase
MADEFSNYSYVLVMERGGDSLFDVCSSKRIAGYDVNFVRSTLKCIVELLIDLHERRICHGDLKQRNVLRMGDRSNREWLLCDMNASADFGKPVGKKTSSAYSPPDFARKLGAEGCFELSKRTDLITAEPSFDVWSLGVVIFELCSGCSLFTQDIADDELVSDADMRRLCLWNTISDAELEPVFKGITDQSDAVPCGWENTIADVKNLIRCITVSAQ